MGYKTLLWILRHREMMKRWGKRTSAKCPRCDLDEDATHVWKCRGSGADEIWMKAMDKFKKELVMAHRRPRQSQMASDVVKYSGVRLGRSPAKIFSMAKETKNGKTMAIGDHPKIVGCSL
jgi:hypothetical protein